MAGPALVVLIMIARRPSAVTIRGLGKDSGSLLTGPENHNAHLGRSWRSQLGREGAQAWGAAFIEVEGGGPGVSQAPSLLVNLKHTSGDLKRGMRKQTSSPEDQLLTSTEISETKASQSGRRLGSVAARLALYLSQTVLEGHAVPSELKPGTCMTKQREKMSGLTGERGGERERGLH